MYVTVIAVSFKDRKEHIFSNISPGEYISTITSRIREVLGLSKTPYSLTLMHASQILYPSQTLQEVTGCKNSEIHLSYIKISLSSKKKEALYIMSQNKPWRLDRALEGLREDRDVVIAAVQQNAWNLQYAADTLRADREIVITAVKQVGCTLQYAAESIKQDREVVMYAVNQNGWGLQYAADFIRADREVVKIALLNSHGFSVLALALDDVLADREVVMIAIRQNGMNLQYVAEDLRADPIIVLAAIENNVKAQQYASPKLQNLSKDRLRALVSVANHPPMRLNSFVPAEDGLIPFAAGDLSEDTGYKCNYCRTICYG